MLEPDRSRSRRERTFVGGQCAACEELLEHTLRGERVLQFSCGHVAHEACFYEYIKESDAQSQYCPTCDAPLGLDSFRGGSILDLSTACSNTARYLANDPVGKLSNLVRSVAQKDMSPRSSANTPMPWDRQTAPASAAAPDDNVSTRDYYNRNSRDPSNHRDSRDSQRMRIERLGISHQTHSRTDSGNAPSGEFEHNGHPRKHDYDLHAMETSVTNAQLKDSRSSIPAPSVTVRSEFPTLTRSRQQQSLACLVTIEVPEGRWHAPFEDLQNAPPVPPLPSDPGANYTIQPTREPARQIIPYESPEVLEEITEELRIRVDNWHGLEFQRYAWPPIRQSMYIVTNSIGLVTCACTDLYVWEKIVSRGKNSNATSLAKCSFASRRKRALSHR
jgi:hypothetical protein